ncbi:MAG: hypothetical protein EKK69_09815 [Candidatus Competibacteraceae bacterium]|nr:MAG: hypothetical protein EKK69_09815 [Candidatus Competibacteraceae bacterium]
MKHFISTLLTITFLVITIGFMPGLFAQTTNNPSLFKEYIYDTPSSVFLEKDGYYDCSDDTGDAARCMDNVDFVGHKFTIHLMFTDQHLTSVTLITDDFNQDVYLRIAGALGKTFTPCMLQGATERLDLIELARTSQSKSDFQSKMSSFESVNLSNGELTYIFVELPGSDIRGKKNAIEAIMSAPANTRTAELSVEEDTEDNSKATLSINFTLPKLSLEKMNKKMSDAPVEKF